MKDMLGRYEAVSSSVALARLIEALGRHFPKSVAVSLDNALGRVCANDILAPEDLPSFARSTVDGYAVIASDTFGAAETMPAYLRSAGEIFMGEESRSVVSRGEAIKIPTGGMLPEGADSVIMLEYVQTVDETMIELLRPVVPGENIVKKGEDVVAGETLLIKGRRLRPQDIGACAGLGLTEITVYERPIVSIISTGDEIVQADASPASGKVRDINSFVLAALVRTVGCEPIRKGIYRDDYDVIRSAIDQALEDSDAIVISGGTSVGAKDMIARIIGDIGSPGVLFHGVSLKPGKPMIGGMLGTKPVFGLPGHPVAVAVCFDIFMRPVLNLLSGMIGDHKSTAKTVTRARLSRNISSVQGREEHIRVIIEEREDGPWAVPVLGKSGLISTLVKADGTIVVPIHVNGIESGEMIDVQLFV